MSATLSDLTQGSSQLGPTSSVSYAQTVLTTIYPSASDEQVLTTTIYQGTPLPTTTTLSHPKSTVPVAAIAGGAAGGVFLAVAVVVIWVWWGRCIQRKREKDRREIVRHLVLLWLCYGLLILG